jgi:hypothetical protein
MHVKADLLNSVRNVWAGERQVLESSSKAAEVCSIRHRGPVSCNNLRIGVNWSGAWLALCHACTVENVQHVLSLRKEKTITTALNLHAKKVMQFTKIFHGELSLKG